MAKPVLKEFLDNRTFLAMKLSSSEVPGFFQKKFTVPLNTTALALYPDGTVSRLAEGREVLGKFDLLIVKDGDTLVRFPFENLRSADAFPVTAALELHMRIQTNRDDLLKDFARAFFNFPGHYTLSDLKTALGPEMRRLVGDFVAARTASALHKHHLQREFETAARTDLERHFFATGVGLVRFGDVAFESPEWATRAAAEARRTEDERRRNEKMVRKEEKIRRLAGFLQEQGMKELIEKIPDARARGVIYAKLMEDDAMELNPREIASRLSHGSDDLTDLLFRTMEGLLAPGMEIDPMLLPVESGRRIYCAIGAKVLDIDPSRPGDKPREFSFKDPLRSVRPADIDGDPALLVGCKRTVHLLGLEDQSCKEYPLPGTQAPKGGVNAVASTGEHLFATHSEYGLVRWSRAKPGAPGDLVYAKQTAGRKTTRGVTVAGARLLFASGATVFSAPIGDGTPPTAFETGIDTSVTALAVGGGRLFAGTDNGDIVAWELEKPERPVTLVRRQESIAQIRLVRIAGIPHLLYAGRDLPVRARVIGQTLETSYESGGTGFSAFEAASDLVAACDTAGRRLLLWHAAEPAKPYHEMDLGKFSEKPALDLGMRKVAARSEEPAKAGK